METLINMPTRIFAEIHGEKAFSSSSTSSSSVVPWRQEIRFAKSSNRTCLVHLQGSLPHRKPFNTLPFPNSQVGSGKETAKTRVPQTDELKVAHVRLQLKKECQYGEHFLVVGDDPVLGSWNPLKAVPLSWSDGHIWTVDLELPVGKTIQYKFICKLSTTDVVWQPGLNRTVQVRERQNVVIVREDWENADTRRIYVKQQIIKQEKPVVDTPKIKTNEHFGESSFLNKKLMVRAKDGDDTSITHTSREGLRARDPECLKKEPYISEGKMGMGRSAKGIVKEELPARKSNNTVARNNRSIVDTEDEGESLVIYNEGHVLVPGLTVQVIPEEAVTKELKNSILASSSGGDDKPVDKNKPDDEGESLVTYDEGHVLVPGLTAQMITEEALTKELRSLNGADKSVKNNGADIPPW